MDISHLDNLNIKYIEPKIINLINDYKEEFEKFELQFFEDLPDYIDERFLNIYFDKDFTPIFKNNIDIKDKLKLLSQYDIEINDIQNIQSIEVKYTDNSYYFKWLIFKCDIYENTISSTVINYFKHFLLCHKKNIQRKSNIFTFTLDDIIKISTSNSICLHCVLKDFINLTSSDNYFITLLKKKIN